MKRLNFILIVLAISTATVLTSSCAKEKGCTDPDSKNYSSTAEEDDGTCEYQGKIIFFYKEDVAHMLLDNNIHALTYYVDDELVGSSSASTYWNGNSNPDCGQEGLITTTRQLGKVKSKTVTFAVKDENGNNVWHGETEVEANGCKKLKLIKSN